MAKQVIERLVDDIDGGEADETVLFGLDGVSYEIDLSDTHAQALRENLAEYIDTARKAGAARRRRRNGRQSSRERSAAIRTWAKERGIQVNERGRIPANIVDEYEKTH